MEAIEFLKKQESDVAKKLAQKLEKVASFKDTLSSLFSKVSEEVEVPVKKIAKAVKKAKK